ncbi:MAG: site-2 protease family protein [Candidatus Nanoarchaeia archaeon]
MKLDLNLISVIVFYFLVFLFLIVKRKRIEVQSKIFFLFKTLRFNRFLNKIANKNPKFWQVLGLIGIPISLGGVILIFVYLSYSIIKFLLVPSASPTIALALPGIKVPGSPIFIPFWYGIIALFTVIIVHEATHGILAEANKIKIKSSGFGFLLGLLPLAFVEPDEKKLTNSSTKTQLSVYSGGPFANFLAAGVFMLLAFGLTPILSQTIEPSGIYLEEIAQGGPAELAGLQKGQIITGINNLQINKIEDFISVLNQTKPGENIILLTADGTNYSIKTSGNPQNTSKAYIGITFKQNIKLSEKAEKYGSFGWLPWHVHQLFFWIYALNLGIGLINLLPLGPIDGGRIIFATLNKIIKKKEKAKKYFYYISLASLMLLLLNILLPLCKSLLM